MKYFKAINNGRILGVGATTASKIPNEITKAEFEELSVLLAEPHGDGYALMESTLSWEPYESPADEEIPDSEALSIIVGGESNA